MRVLVTGGAGFIGSHVVERLLGRGDDVRVLDDLSTGDAGNLADVRDHERLEVTVGSILDDQVVAAAMDGREQVFHLAAAVGVQRVVEQPLASLRTNLDGSQRVIDHAARVGAGVLFTSSSEVYGRSTEERQHEDDDRHVGGRQTARWWYAEAKAVIEAVLLAHHREQALPVVVARLFNTVGPRQVGTFGMVVPRFVSQAQAAEPLTVHGDGSSTRCFAHVQDVARALVELADTPSASGQVVNVGGTVEVSMLALAGRIVALTGSSSSIDLLPHEDVYGPDFEDLPRRVPDTDRLAGLLGWRPDRPLDDILQAVIDASAA